MQASGINVESNQTPKMSNQYNPKYTVKEEGNDSSTSCDKGLGVPIMIRSFPGIPKYGGGFEYNLDESIEAFKTVAELCEATQDVMENSRFPILFMGLACGKYSIANTW